MRPSAPPSSLLHLTAVVAVLVCLVGCDSANAVRPDAAFSDRSAADRATTDHPATDRTAPPPDAARDAGQPRVDGLPAGDSRPLRCPAAVDATTREQMLTELAKLQFQALGPYTSAHLPITPDIRVSGTITLTSADIPAPAGCAARDDCRKEVYFAVMGAVPGVTTAAADPMYGEGYWGQVTITSATVRLRPVLYDMHPSRYNFIPVVLVYPTCEVECGEGALKCAEDGVCYGIGGRFADYCRLCLAQSKEVCACFTPSGQAGDGTDCQYMVSGDVMCNGICQDGICKSTHPGAGCP
jgi:hypothetical protein